MLPKVDWPAAHGTDNSMATKNEDTLLNMFESPYSLARFQGAKQCLENTGTSVKKS